MSRLEQLSKHGVELTANSQSYVFQELSELIKANPTGKYRVYAKEGKKRSLRANSQYHVWIPDISNFICEDIKTTTNMCKLDFGLPIILADPQLGPKLKFILDRVNFNNMTREQQVNFMEMIQVTSLMDTKQHNKMRDDMVYYYQTAGLNIGYQDD